MKTLKKWRRRHEADLPCIPLFRHKSPGDRALKEPQPNGGTHAMIILIGITALAVVAGIIVGYMLAGPPPWRPGGGA